MNDYYYNNKINLNSKRISCNANLYTLYGLYKNTSPQITMSSEKNTAGEEKKTDLIRTY